MLAVTQPSRRPVPGHTPFTRRLRELIAQENSQGDVARRMGYTGPRISQVARGERPSREFVERLIQAYDLDREEWLALAGYGETETDPTAALIQRAADAAVERMVKQMKEEAQEPETPQQWLLRGISGLEKELGQTISVDFHQEGYRNLTWEGAAKLLADLREVLRMNDPPGDPLGDTK